MTVDDAITNIISTYGKYGITDRKALEQSLLLGVEKHGMSVLSAYNGMRMVLGERYGVQELFTTSEVAEMLGRTQEEIIAEVETMKAQLEAEGEDISDYMLEVQPSTKFLFPNGIGGAK